MTLYLSDVIPIDPQEYQQRQEARQKAQQERLQREQKQLQQEQEKQATDKKSLKAKRKAEKKAAKARKKAEKQAQKSAKSLSSAPATTITVEMPSGTTSEPPCAAMPAGIVLALCASLLVCCGSAWFYRRFQSDPSER